MRTRTLAEYLALPWQPFVDTLTQGQDVSVRLTVPGLADFAVYGDSVTEVRDRFPSTGAAISTGTSSCSSTSG